MRITIIITALTALSACDNPPCLAPNQPAAVEQVGIPLPERNMTSNEESRTLKLRLTDGTKRVCIVPKFVADQLKPGDVIRGPISHESDWRFQ